MPIPFPVLLLHPYSTSSFPCSAPSNHANNQLCTLQPFLDSCAGDFLKWAQEAETRNRKSLVVLLHWFPLWAPDSTLRGTAWTMRPSCQGTYPPTLIPLSWESLSAWEAPAVRQMLFWTPEEALGQSKRDPEAYMWWGAASTQMTMHHWDTQVTRGSQGSDASQGARLLLPLPNEPQRGSCNISLSFPEMALTFLPSLSSLCFFFPMQWSLHVWA